MTEVVCGIIYKEDKIFIARKKKGKSLAGFWEFPGGKIEKNESPEEALERELNEELGMSISIKDYLGSNHHEYSSKKIKLIAYNCIYIDATLNLIDHDEFKWVMPSDLINYQIAPADIPLIKFIIEKN